MDGNAKTPMMAKSFKLQSHRLAVAFRFCGYRELTEGLKSMLNINAKVTLLEPNTLPRSEGKAKRVIDKRKLHD